MSDLTTDAMLAYRQDRVHGGEVFADGPETCATRGQGVWACGLCVQCIDAGFYESMTEGDLSEPELARRSRIRHKYWKQQQRNRQRKRLEEYGRAARAGDWAKADRIAHLPMLPGTGKRERLRWGARRQLARYCHRGTLTDIAVFDEELASEADD